MASRLKDGKLATELALTIVSPIDQENTKDITPIELDADLRNIYKISMSPFSYIAFDFNFLCLQLINRYFFFVTSACSHAWRTQGLRGQEEGYQEEAPERAKKKEKYEEIIVSRIFDMEERLKRSQDEVSCLILEKAELASALTSKRR